MRSCPATRAAWGLVGLAVVLKLAAIGFTIALAGRELPDYDSTVAEQLATLPSLLFCVVGALIVTRAGPRHPAGWILLAFGLYGAIETFGSEYATYALVAEPGSLAGGLFFAWLISWLWVIAVPPLATLFLLTFPDGRLPWARWRWAARLALASIVLTGIGMALTEGPLEEFPARDNPLGVPGAEGLSAASVLFAPLAIASLWSLGARYRRSAGDERQQLRWMGLGAAMLVLGLFTSTVIGVITEEWFDPPTMVGIIAIAIAAAVAILRYRLYDLDLVVNRALVYGALTLAVAAVYIGLVLAAGALLDSTGLGISLAATALVAVAVQPLRDLLQRRVDRLMYGDRDDPYRALSRLGQRLEGALEPDQVLPAATEAIAEGLRLPYAAIELIEQGRPRLAASHGEPRGEPLRLPLEHRGEVVGTLLVAQRSPAEPLSSADLRLLDDLARQTGGAADAVRLTRDLRRSRERLVTAREEERRRLRHDLHDGLGPVLAGIALEVESARGLVGSDPAAARELLTGAGEQARGTIAEVRRIARELLPTADLEPEGG